MVVVANRMSSTTTTLPGTRTLSSSSFLVRTWTLWLRSILAAKKPPAFHREHELAALVDRLPAVLHQSDAFARGRGARLEHHAPVGEGVPGAHRLQPAHVVDAGRAQARRLVDVTLAHQAHAHRAGVPAAGDQAAEHGFFRQGRVDMERLRVVLPAESDDLLLGEGVPPEL